MIARITGAFVRAALVAVLIVTPAVMLPEEAAPHAHLAVVVTLLAALLVFVEYCARSPSILEFRDAAPFNRLRYLAVFTMVLLLTLLSRGADEPTLLTGAVGGVGALAGQAVHPPLDVLLSLMLPANAEAELLETARQAAGICLMVSLTAILAFAALLRLSNWPTGRCGFNVWVNLPLFDPSTGEDVPRQLRRDARFNIWLGLALPFLIPAVVKLTSFLINPLTLEHPQALIWTLTAWAFLPASTIMRGLALGRIADTIEATRRQHPHQEDAKVHLQPV